MALDDDWPEVVQNLQKEHQKWVRMSRVLIREGVYARTSGSIYVAVSQVIMLYRLETWVMTLLIGRVLGGFRHRVAHRLMGRQYRRGNDVGWVYPPLEDAMTEAGLQEVETYVSCRQNTLSQFIVTRTIMELCLAMAQRPGSRMAKWCWYKYGLYLTGQRQRRIKLAERILSKRNIRDGD